MREREPCSGHLVCIETDGAASTMRFVLRTFVCEFPSAYPEMQPRSLENKGRRVRAERFLRGEKGRGVRGQILLSNFVEHHICIFSSFHKKGKAGSHRASLVWLLVLRWGGEC